MSPGFVQRPVIRLLERLERIRKAVERARSDLAQLCTDVEDGRYLACDYLVPKAREQSSATALDLLRLARDEAERAEQLAPDRCEWQETQEGARLAKELISETIDRMEATASFLSRSSTQTEQED